MGDDQNGALVGDQVLLQPGDGFGVKVVGRLVQQQHIGRFKQQLAQRDAPPLAAGEAFDIGIIGQQGRAALLREVAKGLQMSVDDIVPSREKLAMNERLAAATAALQMPAPGGGQPAAQNMDLAGAPAGGTNLVNGGQP